MSGTPSVEFKGISKSFSGNKVLDSVSFEIQAGEIHALLGENGAGKSTLLNILHGVYSDYEGVVTIEGGAVAFANAHQAIQFGISKVHQEVNVVTDLTVGQNIAIGYEPVKGIFIDYKKLYADTEALLKKLKCRFKSTDLVSSLSAGELQMLSIAKALYHRARVISFDEPTASLTDTEANILFEIIEELKNQGITIIYVSHRLDEIFKIAQRATVLRDGKYIGTFNVADITREQLIQSMVGRDVSAFAVRNQALCATDEVVMEVNHLSRENVFQDISFQLRKGEILGIAGLVGSKRTDLVRTIFGADKKTGGEIIIKGKKVRITHPKEGLMHGIGLIPEERKTQGFIKLMTNADNMGMASLSKFSRFGFVNHSDKEKNCLHYIREMNLNQKDPHYITSNLSGGNQQKVILAKWLSTQVDILILDEPTKGVDVGAKAEIYRLMEELLHEGKSIIMVSSELPEVIGMSDRVMVMHEGRKIVELDRKDLTEKTILHYAMGGQSLE